MSEDCKSRTAPSYWAPSIKCLPPTRSRQKHGSSSRIRSSPEKLRNRVPQLWFGHRTHVVAGQGAVGRVPEGRRQNLGGATVVILGTHEHERWRIDPFELALRRIHERIQNV